jgi:hypothetical protein
VNSSGRSVDVALAVLLFVAAAIYLSVLPYGLNAADESYFLYEAKRVRDGEVMYRDVFEFATPLAAYAMAGLFWLFGTSVATARTGMAFLHALTGVVLYASSRRLGVRRELAATVPLAYLAICQTVWPYASWHWFSTFFTSAVLLSMITCPWATRTRWMFVPGLLNGLLICVQQQKGVVLAAGTGAVLVVDFLIDRRYPNPGSWRALAMRFVYLTAGVALVVVPVLLAFALAAGVQPLYDALVRFPLENYRANFRSAWGAVGILSVHYADYTFPAVLKYAPLALLLPVANWAIDIVAGWDRPGVRRLTALIVLSAACALSIRYFPDMIHVAFVAGVFWVAAAQGLEWVLSAVRRPALTRPIGIVMVALLGSGLVLHLAHNARLLRGQFPVSHETAFGRLDFADRWEPVLLDKVRQLVAETPSRELFCYPYLSLPYLATGARNPTPYQFLMSGVSPDQHVKNTLAILDAHRVPYVIGSLFFMRPDDPIAQYINQHYEFIPVPEIAGLGEMPGYWIYARKDPPPAEDGAPQADAPRSGSAAE